MADIDTSKIDFERISMLLDVVHKQAGVGPKLTYLGNAAMSELTKINDSIMVAAQPRSTAQPAARAITGANPTKPDPDEGLVDNLQTDTGDQHNHLTRRL